MSGQQQECRHRGKQTLDKRLATGIRPSTFEPAIRSIAAIAHACAYAFKKRTIVRVRYARKYGEGARCLSSKYNTCTSCK